MLRIRLRKPAKCIKHRYHFKIVVADARESREGRFVEEVGYYDPANDLLKMDLEKIQDWIKKGAQPTETVKSLIKRYKKLLKSKENADSA